MPGLEEESNGAGDDDDVTVSRLLQVVYRTVFPCLIVTGVLCNVAIISVLVRSTLIKHQVNRYFLVLAVSDLLGCLANVPIVVTANGCCFLVASSARYFAHLGWTLMNFFPTLSLYMLLCLSLDQFLSVYSPVWFNRTQTKNVFVIRTSVSVLMCVLLNLYYAIDVSVQDTAKPLSLCPESVFVIILQQREEAHKLTYRLLYYAYELLSRWMPDSLLVVFNVGLAWALFTGRYNQSTLTRRNERRDKIISINLICLATIHLVFLVPTSIYFGSYIKNKSNMCYFNKSSETIRAWSNTSQLAEHIIRTIFIFLLNRKLRQELMALTLCSYWKPSTNNTQNNTANVNEGLDTPSQRRSYLSERSHINFNKDNNIYLEDQS